MEKSLIEFKNTCIDITPTKRLPLAGYGLDRITSKVSDKLEINIILLKDGLTEFCFVSVDLLFLSEEFCAIAIEKLGLPSANVFLGATHTHSAPNIDSSKERLGQTDRET